MKTIILAAGGWTRLLPFTLYKAKALVNILGKPLLEYILENVYDLTDEYIIVIKFFKDEFKNYFWNNYKWKKITYIYQWEEKWTAASLFNLNYEEFEWEKILIMNWDNIICKEDLINFANSIENYWCLAKFSNTPSNHWVLNILNNNNDNVLSITEKPNKFIWNLVNWWVYIVNNEIIKIAKTLNLSSRWEYEITDAMNIFMNKNIFNYYEIKNRYFHITSPIDLYTTSMFMLNNNLSISNKIEQNWKNYIWNNCKIWNKVHINNSIINDWVTIWNNCILNNCLIWENSYISENFNFNSESIKIFWPNTYLFQNTTI